MATPTGRNNTIIWIAVAVIVILGLAYWGGLFGQRTATETTPTTPPAAEQPTPPAATEQPTPPPATEAPSPAPAQPTPAPQ